MKFETKGHDREVDHPKKFGEDLCTKVHARSKNVHVRIKTCTHAYLCLVCTWFYTKLHENCIDHPLLCHDLSFCCGHIRKIMLNMHTRGIIEIGKFQHMHLHVFALCARALIFTKFFLVVHYSAISLIWSAVEEIFVKLSEALFLPPL